MLIWAILLSTFGLGYMSRWWQARPEAWWHECYLKAQAERMARHQLREALEKVRSRHHA